MKCVRLAPLAAASTQYSRALARCQATLITWYEVQRL
jgi:hypothetical protein